jgi:hypothetical protein
MIGSVIDQRIFESLVSRLLPDIHQHLQQVGLPLEMLSFSWFMTLFISSFEITVGTRILDCFFYEGREIFFKVGLALFKMNQSKILSQFDPEKIMETIREKSIDCGQLFNVITTVREEY